MLITKRFLGWIKKPRDVRGFFVGAVSEIGAEPVGAVLARDKVVRGFT
jgi:hypothetical protein